MTESDLQEQCNKFLRDNGIVFLHRQKGRTHRPTSQNFIKIGDNKLKFPDLLILPKDNLCYYVELKTQSGKQSKEQIDFMNYAFEKGYDFFIIRSFEEFKVLITKILKLI